MRPFLPSLLASLLLGLATFLVVLFALVVGGWFISLLTDDPWIVLVALSAGMTVFVIGFFIDRYTEGGL